MSDVEAFTVGSTAVGLASAASSEKVAGQDPFAVSRGRFVFHCAVAAALAYVIADHIGLPHPVWAPMTALIVLRDRVTETLSSVLECFAGTLLGIAVALPVSWLGAKADIALFPQIALGVAICATCASSRPALRMCLWTCPLVLVPLAPTGSTEMTALFRGSEVMLGATVGGAMHFVEERVILPLVRRVLAHPHR